MKRYRATISFEVEVEADNCCAARDLLSSQKLNGPWASSMPTPSSRRGSDHYVACFADFEHVSKIKLEPL